MAHLSDDAAPAEWLFSVLWLPGPIVLCLLLLSERARWAPCIAGAMLGSAIVCTLRRTRSTSSAVVISLTSRASSPRRGDEDDLPVTIPAC